MRGSDLRLRGHRRAPGHAHPGRRIPARGKTQAGERELSEDQFVGLGTLRRALDLLRERGVLATLPRKAPSLPGRYPATSSHENAPELRRAPRRGAQLLTSNAQDLCVRVALAISVTIALVVAFRVVPAVPLAVAVAVAGPVAVAVAGPVAGPGHAMAGPVAIARPVAVAGPVAPLAMADVTAIPMPTVLSQPLTEPVMTQSLLTTTGAVPSAPWLAHGGHRGYGWRNGSRARRARSSPAGLLPNRADRSAPPHGRPTRHPR